VPEAELDDFLAGDLAPMTLGFNHYATSERFLDHRLALHRPETHGGNGRHRYADTEALRMPLPPDATGWLPRLREAWRRYPGYPLAVTEAHIGCTVDEQVRWLDECWQAVATLRAEGAPIQAVTAWALFGAVDWCSLLTRQANRYEPGAFDAGRGGRPSPTLLAEAVAGLARQGRFEHPLLASRGWWAREDRIHPELRRTG
jgi:dTDP-4-dehydrorhamnose reductase